MSNLLFVYGTLRRGHANPMAEFLANSAEFIGDGQFQGRMYQISYYPGVVASDDPNDCVYGEIYRLYDPQTVITVLDDYEECSAQHIQPAEYKRDITHILAMDGNLFEQVWIYLYQWPVEDKLKIASGHFI